MHITSSHYTLLFCLFQKDATILYYYYEKFKKCADYPAYLPYAFSFASHLLRF